MGDREGRPAVRGKHARHSIQHHGCDSPYRFHPSRCRADHASNQKVLLRGGVYGCMNLRRGCVFEENPRAGTPLVQVKAHLPVSESFGFVAALRQATSGQAFPQCIFDHWENLQGDALEEGSKLQDLILKTGKRKNIKVEMPKLADYLDKL